jgi:aminoglycoside phosphotransferase (APT) family kinase protein
MNDLSALSSWLRQHDLHSHGEVVLHALTGGQSNPTYLIETGHGKFILRRRPDGKLLPSAHAVDREFRVMGALAGTGVPVPKVFAYCDDVTVLGTPFFVMEYLEGRVLMDQSLPRMDREERRAIYREMNRVIARLHQVDVHAFGLSDFGKSGNYLQRQIARWTRQCEESALPIPAAMERLADWLPRHIPAGDQTALVHGDYRLDNLVLHRTEPRIIGVLDWELSTLGHPLVDFANHCMSWHIPAALWRGIGGLDHLSLGIPTESEYVGWYAAETGRSVSEHWPYYVAFSLYRMAAILHGIAARAATGTAAAPDAVEVGRKAGPIADIAWGLAQRYSVGAEMPVASGTA